MGTAPVNLSEGAAPVTQGPFGSVIDAGQIMNEQIAGMDPGIQYMLSQWALPGPVTANSPYAPAVYDPYVQQRPLLHQGDAAAGGVGTVGAGGITTTTLPNPLPPFDPVNPGNTTPPPPPPPVGGGGGGTGGGGTGGGTGGGGTTPPPPTTGPTKPGFVLVNGQWVKVGSTTGGGTTGGGTTGGGTTTPPPPIGPTKPGYVWDGTKWVRVSSGIRSG